MKALPSSGPSASSAAASKAVAARSMDSTVVVVFLTNSLVDSEMSSRTRTARSRPRISLVS